jgi:hypothetical protein
MNGLCFFCQQPVEVVDFRLGEGVVVVRCPACGKEQRLSLSEASGDNSGAAASAFNPEPQAKAPAPPSGLQPASGAQPFEPAFEPPLGFCPKCVAPRPPAANSCPACGLVFGKALSTDVVPSAGLQASFRALGAHWEEAAAHVRFLHLAQKSGELAAAGRLYRIRLAQAPEDAVARASLEATVKMASAPVSVAAIKGVSVPLLEKGVRKKLLLMAVTFLGPSLLFLLVRLLGRN